MRLATRYLTIVLLALLIVGSIGMGVGLLGRHPSGTVRLNQHKRVVFVNLDKLVSQTPDWAALKTMKSTIADIRAGHVKQSLEEHSPELRLVSVVIPSAKTMVPRWKVEADAAQRADEALGQLESRQKQALKRRITTTRKTMTDSAEPDIRVRSQQIEQEASGKVQAVIQSSSTDRLNLKLQLSALKMQLGVPGVDEAQTKQKIDKAEAELSKIDKAMADQIDKINVEADKSVAELRDAAKSKIDIAMTAYAADETRKIDKRISDARERIVTDVSSYDESMPKPGKSKLNAKRVLDGPHIGPAPYFDSTKSVKSWNADAAALEKRIRSNVASTISQLADERGMSVVFSRKGLNVPDKTDAFVKIMKSRGWSLNTPALWGKS